MLVFEKMIQGEMMFSEILKLNYGRKCAYEERVVCHLHY